MGDWSYFGHIWTKIVAVMCTDLVDEGGLDLQFLPLIIWDIYHILSFRKYSHFSVGSNGSIPATPGAISVSGHISNKLQDFYAISNLINFANWSRLVWLSQN